MRTMLAAMGMAAVMMAAHTSQAASVAIGAPVPIGARSLGAHMAGNEALAAYVARRGEPDWVEVVEVDSLPPLDTQEVRIYYLRLNREVAFTNAYILGRPYIGIQRYERPLTPEMRRWIEEARVAADPALRAERAADRAEVAAERAERGADAVVASAEKAERVAKALERSFHKRLHK